jgi:hypothetical protein
MKPRLAIALGALALVGVTAAPASAGGAAHEFVIEDDNAYEPFAAGDGPCVSWAGTFTRSGQVGTA